jgi:hypothetical protein
LAELTKKPDDLLEGYLQRLIALSKETLSYFDKESKKIQEDGSLPTMEALCNTANPSYPKADDGETLTLDRAKKVIKRLALFEKLRNCLDNAEALKSKLDTTKRFGNAILPKWWTSDLDLPFMIGCSRYGFNRSDLFISGRITLI